MGGQHGMRGYLLQAIVTVIDSLSKNTKEWVSVSLEPSIDTEKVDVKWKFVDGTEKVAQIKSSQNTIHYWAAKKWILALRSEITADVYELVCIGHVDSKINDATEIESTKITVKPLDFEILLSESMTKIDAFFEEKGKAKVNSTIREVLISSLNYKLSKDSIFGRVISRSDFDNTLLGWLEGIEKHVQQNPFMRFMSSEERDLPLGIEQKIAKNFLSMIGWGNYSPEETTYYDPKTLTHEKAKVDFYLSTESKLRDNAVDHILLNTVYDYEYPDTAKSEIRRFLTSTAEVSDNLKYRRRIDPDRKNTIFNILFWISTKPEDLNNDFIYENKDHFRNDNLRPDQQYYFVDNSKANFIISSIATARNYRPDLPAKFFYPITEFNLSYNKIGKRGTQLPPEYINTNILPMIKEDSEKISVLLFCSDPYDKKNLQKIIWLMVMLTSGLANEYLIYFSDYEDSFSTDISEVLSYFDNSDLAGKVKIKRSQLVDTQSIAELNLSAQNSAATELEATPNQSEIRINPIFREQLPYGDLLKPILNTDKISAQDIKIFLSLRGIFIKNADKKKLIDIMVTLLFSPQELVNFINLINIKERPLSSIPTIITLKENQTVKAIFETIRPDFTEVTKGLQAKLNHHVVFAPDPSATDTFVFSSYVEKKDPTKHIALGTTWEPIKISYEKVDNKLLVSNVETNSRDGKIIANRIIGIIKDELLAKDHIENEVLQLKFSDFEGNRERVDFLLSFVNITSSNLFISQDIKTLKFIFDETKNIPEEYQDKTEKDLVILFRGKKLAGLREITEDHFRDIILLEEVSVTYHFELNGVKGYFNVRYNFSDALKAKPIINGDFRTQSYLYSNMLIKQVKNISFLEKQLSQEVERLKIEKFRLFNKI